MASRFVPWRCNWVRGADVEELNRTQVLLRLSISYIDGAVFLNTSCPQRLCRTSVSLGARVAVHVDLFTRNSASSWRGSTSTPLPTGWWKRARARANKLPSIESSWTSKATKAVLKTNQHFTSGFSFRIGNLTDVFGSLLGASSIGHLIACIIRT